MFMESLKGKYNPSNDRLRFTEAADMYIEHRSVAAAAGTVRLEKERLRAAKKLLSQIASVDLKLKDIDIKLIRTYQQKRIGEGVGPRTVNMEGQLLRSILKHHEQWKLDGKYEPLPEPTSEAGRSLTPVQEVNLIDAARSCPQWAVAYHGTILENETGMRGVEVRNLQLKRVDLLAGEIHLQKSKTKGGVRTVPLNSDALESAKELVIRSSARSHRARPLPHSGIRQKRARGKGWDCRSRTSLRSVTANEGLRTAWRKLTEKAGLRGLRGHDLRHNWVTGHAEIGTPQSVLEAQAGHLSKRMSDRYKHISEKAGRKASEELSRVKTGQRAEARAKLQEQAGASAAVHLIGSTTIPAVADAISGKTTVVH